MTEWNRLASAKVVNEPIEQTFNQGDVRGSEIGGGENAFPHDYSVSGWFRWTPMDNQREWHFAFRLTMNEPSMKEENILGSRDLSMWVGTH